jgi:ABC-type spermidine/putrescine transport system permease subunit II
MKALKRVYMALILILLYAPIATLIVLSFNASKSRAKWGGFTLKWYRELLSNEEIMEAFYTTLMIALIWRRSSRHSSARGGNRNSQACASARARSSWE